MDNNLKIEFKDFISTLTTEICEGVLLEELKDINNSFNETSNNYKSLTDNYAKNINGIKEELIQLHTTNGKLDGFITNINANNDKVNRALNIIDGSHKEVIDKIIVDNKKLFDQYSEAVQTLNHNQRQQFISELISSMDIQSKKHIAEIRNVVDGSEIKKILNDISSISFKMNSVDSQVEEMRKSLGHTERRIIEALSNNLRDAESRITNKINELNNIADDSRKKNSIIMILIGICIFLILIK